MTTKGIVQHFGLTGYYDGPAIGREDSELTIARKNAAGDAAMQEACLDLFVRTANLRGLTMDEAVAFQLGTPPAKPVPGTERVFRWAA